MLFGHWNTPAYPCAEQEAQQRQRLHVVDRAMYKMGRLVYGDSAARMFAFVSAFV